MAQVTISEEHYQELLALAQVHGITPDELLDTLITEADQRAFWGEHIHEELAEAEAKYVTQSHRMMTDEEFFAELDAHTKPEEPSNADA